MGRLKVFVLTVLLFGLLLQGAWADVVPGDVIDKTNYQKIEGLVPDFILTWVKNGDMTMNIGKLNFDKKDFWPKEVKDNWKANIGKYKIDENNGIIDAKTGERVRIIKGMPFPEPDTNDPKMPVQLMWNTIFEEYFIRGNCHQQMRWFAVNRKGMEKKLTMENFMLPADQEKSKFDCIQLSVLREPFSIAGTGTLVLYGLYPLNEGLRFVWTPELRKVRRISHRLSGTDEHFGLDNGPDDYWSGGSRSAMEKSVYRFIEEKDALVPYVSEDPQKLVKIDDGYAGGSNVGNKKLIPGFEDSNWKGAPWHLTNIIWVKSRVYVFESTSKDPNYAYGPCEGWVEKGTFVPSYKRITDTNGKLWKAQYWCGVPFASEDDKYKLVFKWGQVMVNIRKDHGSTYCGPFRPGTYMKIMQKDINKRLFTRAGFVKFSK